MQSAAALRRHLEVAILALERRLRISLAFVIAVCAAGCSGGGSSTPGSSAPASPVPVSTASAGGVVSGSSPGPSATASPTATAVASATPTPAAVSATSTFAVNGAGASVPLTTSGYAGTLVYPSNDTTTGTATFTLQNTPPGTLPSPQAAGKPVLFFTLQLANRTDFVGSGFAVTNVTLPSTISTAGTFTETFYDETTGTQLGTSQTGTVSSGTIAFGAVEPMSFTLMGGDIYLFEITEQ